MVNNSYGQIAHLMQELGQSSENVCNDWTANQRKVDSKTILKGLGHELCWFWKYNGHFDLAIVIGYI